MRGRWAGLALALLLSLPVIDWAPMAAAQDAGGTSMNGVVLKGKAPVSKELLRVKLPRAKEATLKNGLRVIVLENHKVPTFSMQMVVLSGGLSDPPDHRGLAQFTASLLREGTARRTSKEIAEQIDSLGATLSTSADLASFTSTVNASGLVENLDPVLELFADVARNPTFPKEEVERFKAQTISQLQFQRSSPRFLIVERFYRAIYAEHPAGSTSPPITSIQKTMPEALARFHALYYQPNNAMLAVVGDLTLGEMLPKIERAFGDWERGDVPKTVIAPAPAQPGAKVYLINRPGSVQTALRLGNLGIERTDPEYFALLVMDQIEGGGPTSRLFTNIREEKGYTYDVRSLFNGSKYRGIWAATSDVRTDVTEGAMREFMAEFRRIRDEKVTPTELENAKRAIIGRFALSLEQPDRLLDNIITQKLYDLPADYWDTYPNKVAAITADDVQRVARNYVDLEHLQIVAVGDAPRIRDAMAKYGLVELYDAEGKPISDAARAAPTQ